MEYKHKKNKLRLQYLKIIDGRNYFYSELKMIENDILLGNSIGPDAHRMTLEYISKLKSSQLTYNYIT